MLIWSYLAASPVKIEAKVWMKNWLGNWSWGVRIKTLLVFNLKNSIVVCKFLNSLLTLSLSRLTDPGRRHDLQLYLKSLTQYIKIRGKYSWWICVFNCCCLLLSSIKLWFSLSSSNWLKKTILLSNRNAIFKIIC